MKREFKITEASGGTALTVRVVTRAAKREVAKIQDDGILKVRLTSGPNDGEANRELIEFLADIFEVNERHIEIVAGANARDKLVSIEGISPEELEERIQDLASGEE